MKRLLIVFAAFGLLVPAAQAGVVVETEVKISDSEVSVDTEKFYAEGEMVRMDPHAARGGDDMSAIFRDQTMWFVNHDQKLCQKIDKAGVAELSAQLEAAMKQFENLPPEQRAMMQKMMKGKMPGMEEPPEHRVEKGGVEQVGDYTCTVYLLYSDDDKISEVCVADESVGADVAEAMGAFRAMSEFMEELLRFVQRSPFVSMVESPYTRVDEVNGFPVRVRSYDGEGKVVMESTLKSITRQDLDEAVFAIPKGYKVKDLGDQIKKGR